MKIREINAQYSQGQLLSKAEKPAKNIEKSKPSQNFLANISSQTRQLSQGQPANCRGCRGSSTSGSNNAGNTLVT